MTIQEMCVKYGCDKTPEIYHCYAPIYDELFKNLKPSKILEIGVGSVARMQPHVNLKGGNYKYQVGVSLRIWAKYFPEAKVYGLDVDPEAMYEKGRITTFLGSSTDESVAKMVGELAGPFDIIIDDGSHLPRDQFKTAENFMPYLKEGGLYFCEDVSWPDTFYRKYRKWNPEILSDVRSDSLIVFRP
jgi:cephalosporin hydroxylase